MNFQNVHTVELWGAPSFRVFCERVGPQPSVTALAAKENRLVPKDSGRVARICGTEVAEFYHYCLSSRAGVPHVSRFSRRGTVALASLARDHHAAACPLCPATAVFSLDSLVGQKHHANPPGKGHGLGSLD